MKQEHNQLIYASIVVAAANIGGVWSPIGNTTSILLWVGGQMTAGGMVTQLFVPAVVTLSIIIGWFMLTLSGHVSKPELEDFSVADESLTLPTSEKTFILVLGLACLLFAPFAKIVWHMEPWEGMVGGLVIYQFTTGVYHWFKGEGFQIHYHITEILRKVDTSNLYFFIGVLMMVSANSEFGNLELLANGLNWLANAYLPEELAVWGITGLIGLLSGVIPNTPIVAAAQEMYPLAEYPADSLFWQLLTFTSGVGGSLFILGSAAGVVMTSIHRNLTFGTYIKIMTLPSLLSFVGGMVALYIQYLLFI